MLDPKPIEENPSVLKNALKARGFTDLLKTADTFSKLRKEWKELKAKLDSLRHDRNVISEAINSALKAGKKQDAEKKKQEARKISDSVKKAEDRTLEIENELKFLELEFPNITVPELPAKDKITLQGKEKREKWMKTYEVLVAAHKMIDFNAGVQMSGAGFYVLTEKGAETERALVNLFLDMRKKQGYKEMAVPILVSEQAMINSGQLPKFRDGMFVTQENSFLIPTSEVSLLNLYAGKTLREEDLPIYITAVSPCFRMEKGATRGYIRVKQFTKVEMFKFVREEDSFKELEKMLKDATETLKTLEIPFRVKLLSASETGFASAKTYDVEAFAPATNEWLEVSSCSNCTDFQARRARIKYITKNGEKKFVHTLNGSGLAVPRTFIALLENHQQKDGSIKIPKALHPYLTFKEIK